MKRRVLISMIALLITGCERIVNEPTVSGRWYTQTQVNKGRIIFEENCSGCHGMNAEGTLNWKETLPDGSYPPPPLNGSAHTWHHPLSVLKKTIDDGGILLGGKMPAFKTELTEKEKEAVIAFVQSHWDEDIYSKWIELGGIANSKR